MKVADIPRANLLGVNVSLLSFSQTIDLVAETISTEGRLAVCPSPVYTIVQGHEVKAVREALNACLATPDGMPVVWALRLLGHHAERVYGPDLMEAICKRSAGEGWGHYFYGGETGVPEALMSVLSRRYSGLKVMGCESPPFRDLTADEDTAMIGRLNESGAQVVWVGLGSPKQDLWLANHRPKLRAPVLIAVGAAFDFLSGRMRQAPYWMQRSGLEWLFRLLAEPKRLWRRYMINNPKFVAAVAMQRLGLRRYSDL